MDKDKLESVETKGFYTADIIIIIAVTQGASPHHPLTNISQ